MADSPTPFVPAGQPKSPMSTRKNIVIGVVIFAIVMVLGWALVGGGSSTDPQRNVGNPNAPATWMDGRYSPAVKARIDSTADCAALQTEFDNADANNAATMNRTGSGTADLMSYIDARMREVGCY